MLVGLLSTNVFNDHFSGFDEPLGQQLSFRHGGTQGPRERPEDAIFGTTSDATGQRGNVYFVFSFEFVIRQRTWFKSVWLLIIRIRTYQRVCCCSYDSSPRQAAHHPLIVGASGLVCDEFSIKFGVSQMSC